MLNPDDKTINLIRSEIRHVCENFSHRTAGSAGEHRCQNYLKDILDKYADSTTLEEFTLHPNAFMGWIKIAVILSLLSVAAYWLSLSMNYLWVVLLGELLILIPILMYLFEFILYRRFVDFLFPRATSNNLIARYLPTGEVKRRIIFGGHADAAFEWRYGRLGKIYTLLPVVAGTSLSLIFILVSNTILFIRSLSGIIPASGMWSALGIAELCCIPFFIAIYFFVNWRIVTCGANDNLSGSFVAMAILKELHDNNIRFNNTEVCCLITGAEEAGLRGSLAYAARHREEFSEVETIFIALDTLRECKQLKVYTRGQTGTQKNSKEVVKLLVDSALSCGIKLKEAKLYPGATDAEAFSRYGLKASALCGVDHNPQTYYHTRKDTWYNVDNECIKNALEISLETIIHFDKEGLSQQCEEAL